MHLLIGQVGSLPLDSLKELATIIITLMIIDLSILGPNSQRILIIHVLDVMVLV